MKRISLLLLIFSIFSFNNLFSAGCKGDMSKCKGLCSAAELSGDDCTNACTSYTKDSTTNSCDAPELQSYMYGCKGDMSKCKQLCPDAELSGNVCTKACTNYTKDFTANSCDVLELQSYAM